MTKKTSRHHKRTQAHIFSIGRVLLVVGIALVTSLTINLGTQYYAIIQDSTNRVVEISASYRYIPNLAALTQQSTLVIEGTVLDNGKTFLVPQPAVQPQSAPAAPAPLGTLPGDKGQQVAANPPASTGPLVAAPDQSLPVTSYTIHIDAVLHGAAPAVNTLTLLMPGGSITRPTFPLGPTLHRTLVVEGNPLLVHADHQVFFLGHNPDGTYFLIGGPQSRFQIVGRHIHVMNRGIPLAKDIDGELENQFVATIRSIPNV